MHRPSSSSSLPLPFLLLSLLPLLLLLLPQPTHAYYKPRFPHNGNSPTQGRTTTTPLKPAIPPRPSSSSASSTSTHTHTPQPSTSTSTSLPATTTTTTTTEGAKKQLVGAANFIRKNPYSDRFQVLGFHHIEFYTGDATNTYRRFQLGLGMELVAKSDLSTGNQRFASYVLKSGGLQMVFTAPYAFDEAVLLASKNANNDKNDASASAPVAIVEEEESLHPGFNAEHATSFFHKHGLAARAIGLEVTDAAKAYEECIKHGGQAALAPTRISSPSSSSQNQDKDKDKDTHPYMLISEVRAYGDVVLRFLSRHNHYTGHFLPTYHDLPTPTHPHTYGLERLDHAVGNVYNLLESVNYMGKMTGFHEFAEFTAEDVGTLDSGLNSIVLANNEEEVLLPLNEPTYGTKRKSQIQTYLEYNNGPGLQHLALATNDIFATMQKMREVSVMGGFEFMERPAPTYYQELPARIGEALTQREYEMVEELGLLADKDDQGVLLQIFTKPVGDRPTLFLEIIQRIGCVEEREEGGGEKGEKRVVKKQKGGCGGFGKGNFAALFAAIERYEEKMKL